ncbi:Cof-type HAD-IIB family hydrolase [Porphyromonas sp. COT-239 OH1446]|uniref:Cof-type HAD-IIB family hydrolase n=1 Tax=Porphyromonas sp. COT-239 OH1446 TaxID=1515613 RepID=UPI00052BB4A8|nr:Cof-type HAD-IIB family hydrolase [Porphyromonas sp. COT-239 OH1446]KGN70041.1 haloacid dehalogenase [Porphyromonas sp. COT-239 OH1446]
MKYKLMAIDVDGTLVNDSGELTELTRVALLRAQEEFGIRLIIASGRPLAGLRGIAQELQLERYSGYLMPFNGGEVYNCRLANPIAQASLGSETIASLYDLAQEHGLNILTYTSEDEIISECIDDPYLQLEVGITGMKPRQVVDFVAANPSSRPKCLIVGPSERIEALEPIAQERLAGRVNVFRSHPSFLELVPWGVHKASSISQLVDRLGYTAEELIAVGDSFNDLEMIQYAGLGVAMANAKEAIKSCAEYVTLSNNEDGIAHLLNKYIFTPREDVPYTIEEINSIVPGTLMDSLGIRCTAISRGYVEGTMPVDKRTRQPMGILHGGANLAFAETMAGLGSVALLEEGEIQVGMQVSGNHISSAIEGDMMRAEARIMHQGRSTHLWSVEIYSLKSGKLIHTARILNSILKRR